ncbi:LysM peptidoglycan-binding domain-containing protein [Cohnella yongneupensis]|uniref:LysM peptidoglycan-binding domain-containing protein n=1 Tax=Cohnella yongneupensis TaxID=425006 RepID=A0ABW0QWF1_9BACL
MTEPPNGLRFDIYERVHLPDDVAAIEELEEIELVPHMQVLPQEDNVLLSGHLLLSGVYRSQFSQEALQLQHWIPVEITLPLNRIQNVDEIAVEIDNFDVDLLSTRSLNVTGVLALRGLQVSAAQVPIWKDDSFTVVHQAQPGFEADFERDSLSEEAQGADDFPQIGGGNAQALAAYGAFGAELALEPDRDDAQPQLPQQAGGLSSALDNDDWLSKFKSHEDLRIKQEQARQAESAAAYPAERWGDLSERRVESPAQRANAPAPSASSTPASAAISSQLTRSQSEALALSVAEEANEPAQLSVNVSSYDQQRIQSGVGLLSQLGDIGARRESELKQLEAVLAEEKAASGKNAASSSGDELEWTRLFLSSGNEAQSFRKVRMCIVQRDDTLEAIAGRYNVQPRALQLHNRLNDPYLSEGQVLYIP